jgi:SAM-dependent methyltransferase
MGNAFKGIPAHSAEYFGDTRDHWWNDDFIEMLGKRWHVENVRTVLDVGCGVGHWGRLIARVLPTTVRLTGIDREERWIAEARKRAADGGLSERFEYRVASAESLPFEDGSFDLVTCQTLLIHVGNPGRVLGEMIRVTKPGGLVMAAEPTNIADPMLSAIAVGDPPEDVALMSFYLVCLRGKKALGEGDNLLGEALPRLFRGGGLQRIEVRQNDRGWPMVPPYDSPSQRAQADEILDMAERKMWIWDEATTRRYFLAGGGTEIDFAPKWAAAVAHQRRAADAIRAETFSCSGAGLFYLVWGWRPTQQAGG